MTDHKDARQWQPTHRDKRRGTIYKIIAHAKMQAEDVHHNRLMVVYQDEDGHVWVRSREEFCDGRFEALPASPHEGTQ